MQNKEISKDLAARYRKRLTTIKGHIVDFSFHYGRENWFAEVYFPALEKSFQVYSPIRKKLPGKVRSLIAEIEDFRVMEVKRKLTPPLGSKDFTIDYHFPKEWKYSKNFVFLKEES